MISEEKGNTAPQGIFYSVGTKTSEMTQSVGALAF